MMKGSTTVCPVRARRIIPTPTVPSQTATPAGHTRRGSCHSRRTSQCQCRACQERPRRRKDAGDNFPALVRVAPDRREEQNQECIRACCQGCCLRGPEAGMGSVLGGRAGSLGVGEGIHPSLVPSGWAPGGDRCV